MHTKSTSGRCWLCGRQGKQTRYHLFVKGPVNKGYVGSIGKRPWAARIKAIFEKEEATLAVLTSQLEINAGQMVTLSALGVGRGLEDPVGPG